MAEKTSVNQSITAKTQKSRVGGDPGAVVRMLAQGAKAEALGLQADDERLEVGGRPRVLALPDAQVRQQDVAGTDARERLRQQFLVAEAFARQFIAKEAGRRPAHVGVAAVPGGRQ
ncbi:hypothetical protein D9M69_676020 [compost metagenome]